MLHTRVYTEPDDKALASLPGCPYKVLRYLVNRADYRGICYPAAETIAAATGYKARHIWRALEVLAAADLLRYVRKDELDPITRRKMPNVYQINPDYICLAPDAEAEARAIWSSLIKEFLNVSIGHQSHINQQPESLTNTTGPTPVNPHQKPTPTTSDPAKPEGAGSTADYANQNARGKSKRQKPKSDGSPPAAQREAPTNQRSAPAVTQGSAAPGKFTNPANIRAPLDDWHEQLAGRVRGLGIPLPMARGFVQEYGFDRVQVALSAVGEAILNASAERPAGLFRHIIQRNLADEVAARAAQDYTHYREPDGEELEY